MKNPNNRRKTLDSGKRYRIRNLDKDAAKVARRRCVKKGLTPDLSLKDEAIIEYYYSFAQALSRWSGEEWNVDHIWPIAKGGVHHWCNFQVMTRQVNIKKQDIHDGVSGVSYEQYINSIK